MTGGLHVYSQISSVDNLVPTYVGFTNIYIEDVRSVHPSYEAHGTSQLNKFADDFHKSHMKRKLVWDSVYHMILPF